MELLFARDLAQVVAAGGLIKWQVTPPTELMLLAVIAVGVIAVLLLPSDRHRQ